MTTPSGDFCATEHPWYPSAAQFALMTTADKQQLVTHNEHGARACGWKPLK